jgi:hypothetical protein
MLPVFSGHEAVFSEKRATTAHPKRGSLEERERLFQKGLAPKHKRFSLLPIIQKKKLRLFLGNNLNPAVLIDQ